MHHDQGAMLLLGSITYSDPPTRKLQGNVFCFLKAFQISGEIYKLQLDTYNLINNHSQLRFNGIAVFPSSI